MMTQQETSIVQIATVSGLDGGVRAVQDCALEQLPLFVPHGYAALPMEGSPLLTLELGGLPVGIGVPMDIHGLLPGEVRIAAHGGSIHLQQDGSVHINGVVITKDGEVHLPQREGEDHGSAAARG